MKAHEIIEQIEKIAPLGLNAPWDNSGIQIISDQEKVTCMAVMLDPSPEQVEKALATGVNFILAHHPLSMQPLYPNKQGTYFKVLQGVVQHSAWLYSAHTTLDSTPYGPARWLAQELGLQNLQTLEHVPYTPPANHDENDTSIFGIGFVGDLTTALTYENFCELLAKKLGRKNWQVCGQKPQMVSRVSCCPGSGSSLFSLAAASGADVFITGDVKYHAAMEAPLRVLDVGHFILEEEMMRRFAAQLSNILSVPVKFFAGTDPLSGE